MSKNRQLVDIIQTRLSEDNALIQVITGPRQVGKTTALKTALDGRGLYYSADSPTPPSYQHIEKLWKDALEAKEKILAIDEVQKIPNWSEVVKKLWDQDPCLKVVLTGSSALLVEKGLKETLAGRFELIFAEHWNFQESQAIFNLSLRKYIEFGCYPGSVRFLDDLERWVNYIRDSIIEPAIGRDLLQLHPVQNPSLLRQVFGMAVSLPAQVISLQKLQGQIIERGTLPTIKSYLDLLSDAFLVTGIQKYSDSSFRARKSSPKIIVHDNALLRAFKGSVLEEISSEQFGHYFENIVGARFVEAGWETYYWKDRNREVDFVVIGPKGEHWAIEVKTKAVTLRELEGVLEFCRRNKKFKPCLISLEDQRLDGIETLSTQSILSLKRKF